MIAILRTFWRQRSARERRVLVGGLLAVALLAGYGWMWRPLTGDLARMDHELPRLRAHAIEMRAIAGEIERLRAQPHEVAVAQSSIPELLRRSARAHGLDPLDVVAGRRPGQVRIQLERAPFGTWIDWIDELHRRHRIAVVSTRLTALDMPGLVRIEAELTPAPSAP